MRYAYTGSYNGDQCYIVYVAVNDSNLAYTVHGTNGEILKVEKTGHTH